jgi:HlyD family secretion protein
MRWSAYRPGRRAIIGAAVTLAVIALLLLFGRPTPLTVETGVATTGPLRVTIEEDGRTRAVDRYVVTAPVAGRLQRIELREGSYVAGGAIIARIEPLPLDATMRAQLEAQRTAAIARRSAADAAHAEAAAAREQAARELARRQRLAVDSVIAEEQLERYALAVRATDEQLRAAEQAVRAAAAEIDAIRAGLLPAGGASAIPVRAPGPGVVLRVPERSERIVRAGEPLLEIGDPAALEVVVDLLSADAVRVQPGMTALLGAWGGATLHATVRYVEPAAFTRVSALGVEEQRVNVLLDLESRPPELGDGYRVEASILTWAADSILTVPAAALFRAPDRPAAGVDADGSTGWQLFVMEAGRARLRNVTTGQRGNGRTRIIDGVAPGEVVILFPSERIADGMAVRPGRR